MTAKQTAATAWDNMKSFDWALQKNSTETKFEQFVIYDAAEVLNLNQVAAYIKEIKQYLPLRRLMPWRAAQIKAARPHNRKNHQTGGNKK